MEIPNEILSALKCDQCQNFLSCGPIFITQNNGTTCGRCIEPSVPVREIHYEALAKLFVFPCKYKENGCKATIKFAQEEKLSHEFTCKYKPINCPLENTCTWTGPQFRLVEHCRSDHSDNVLESPCTLTHNIAHSYEKRFLLLAFELLFLIHTKVCTTSKKIYHSIMFMGSPMKTRNFNYKLEIKKDECRIIKSGCVIPRGGDEDEGWVITHIDSLLDMIGKFAGTMFNITMNQDQNQEDDDDENNLSICVKCAEEYAVNFENFVIRTDKGLLCYKCAPVLVPCSFKSKGCTFIDTKKKCEIHEAYFCSFNKWCHKCSRSFGTECCCHIDDILSLTECTGLYINYQVFCRYLFSNSTVAIQIFSRYCSTEIYKYNCKIELRDVNCRCESPECSTCTHTIIKTLNMDNNYNCDWYMKIKEHDLPSSETKRYNISIELNKNKLS